MNLKEELLLAKETEGSIEDKIKLFLSKVLLD